MNLRHRLALALGLLVASPLASPLGGCARAVEETLSTTKLSDGLYLVTGPGGNIVLGVGDGAVYLIDDQIAPMTQKLKAEIAKLTDKPVRFIINTHWHGDHAGGNAAFGEAGAVIVAHDNVRRRLGSEQFIAMLKKKVPPSPPSALPVVTFADAVTLHLNGEELRVFHVEPAHTDGDSIVHFVKADLIHMGDTFMSSISTPPGRAPSRASSSSRRSTRASAASHDAERTSPTTADPIDLLPVRIHARGARSLRSGRRPR